MRPHGFTLIEILIALAIFGLLLLLAGPQYVVFMANSRIRNTAEAVLNGVQLAQATAIQVNTQARLLLNPATGWQIFETVEGVEPPPVQVYALSEGGADASVTPTPAGATQVTFDGFGRVIANADATATLRCVDVASNAVANARALRVVISNTASRSGTKLCDPLAAATEPQFCPAACS